MASSAARRVGTPVGNGWPRSASIESDRRRRLLPKGANGHCWAGQATGAAVPAWLGVSPDAFGLAGLRIAAILRPAGPWQDAVEPNQSLSRAQRSW
jgi:hypothetical protein